jgi:hypothetical protein
MVMTKDIRVKFSSICLIKRGWYEIPRNSAFEDTRVHVTPFFDQQQASFAVLIIYMLSIYSNL